MLKKILLFFLVLVLGLGIAFMAWASFPPAPMPEAVAAMQSTDQVSVQTEPWLTFQPTASPPVTGFIFYPGGRVAPRAYAPYAQALAQEGYLVIIVPMPLNMAIFDADEASQVMAAFPDITHWVIGGHSLGGAMAAQFAFNHPNDVAGLVLLASYPAGNNDLSQSALRVVSISGSEDGLAEPSAIEASHALLPKTTEWVEIQGGNHAQFGWYGAQTGDNIATIRREAQQQQTIEATLTLLQAVNNGP